MKKTTWLTIFILLALVFAVFYFAVPRVKAGTNKNVLYPFSVLLASATKSIYANAAWQTYVAPYQFLWGIVIMGVFAIVWWKILSPRRPHLRTPQVQLRSPIQTTTTIKAQTPVGATTRPETTVQPAPTSTTVEEPPPETEETAA